MWEFHDSGGPEYLGWPAERDLMTPVCNEYEAQQAREQQQRHATAYGECHVGLGG